MVNQEEQQRRELITKMVKEFCMRLREHTDSVQVMTTFHSEDGETSQSFEYGLGSFHARFGNVREWLLTQEEYMREWARTKADEDERDNE